VLSGKIGLDRPSVPDFALARLGGPVRLESRGGELLIDGDLTGEGGAGRGLAAALLGARPRASAQVSLLADGRLLVRRLAIQGAGLQVSASGERGLLGGLNFKGEGTLTNLAAAHAGARGVVKAAWSASQGGGERPWTLSLDARGEGLAAGFGDLDHLLGPAPRLTVKADWGKDALSLASLALDGAAGGVTSSGRVGHGGDLDLKLDWRAAGPITVGPLEIAGAARGSGAVSGTLASPRADLLAHVDAVDLPVLPLKDAQIRLTFAADPGGANGRFALTALSQYGPAKAASAFRLVAGGVDLSGVDMDAGGVTARGAVALSRGEPSSADLTVAIGPGAVLTQGHADGRVRVTDAPGGPSATLDLAATGATLRQGGLAFKTLKLSAQGPLRRLPYTLSAQGATGGGPWKLAGSGLYNETAAGRSASFSGTGRVGRADLKTLTPVSVTLTDHGVGGQAQLAVGTGRLNLDVSQSAGAIKAKAEAANISLALVSEDYVGHMDGTLTLAGQGAALTGSVDARLTGAGGRDLKGAPPVSGEIKARLASGAITLDASLGSAQGFKAQTHVTLPAEASAAPFRIAINRVKPLRGDFAVNGEMGPLWDLLMGGERSLSGRVSASGTLGGTLADPQAVGAAALDEGRFHDVESGLKLDGVTLRAILSADAINVSQVSGTDGAKGTLAGSGRINLTRDGVSSFRLDLKAFRLIDTDQAQASATGSVSINRAADGKAKVTGALTMDHVQIAPNAPIPSGVTPMDVVEIHRPDADDTPLDTANERTAPVALDVTLKASRGVFIKGRGLNVELSLDAHVTGDTGAPSLTGVARVYRGDYDFAGQRFKLDDRSVIRLGATPETIRLDLTATRDNPTLTAVIRIQGTAAKPTIALSSTPALPRDEVLSQVLFGASAAQLSPLQAAQLASALAALSGSGGLDVIGGLRNLAHLDRLAIGGSATPTSTLAGVKYVNQSNTVAGGKYLRDNVYLEIAGGGVVGPAAQVEWRVKKHLSIVSRLAGQGESTLAIRWRKDY
jgi:translocation and assembly module TamB